MYRDLQAFKPHMPLNVNQQNLQATTLPIVFHHENISLHVQTVLLCEVQRQRFITE